MAHVKLHRELLNQGVIMEHHSEVSGSHVVSNRSKGYVLPIVIILSAITLSSLGVWYRQVVLQSHLSRQLLEKRILYNECKSLLPMMRALLEMETESNLQKPDDQFFTVKVADQNRWQVSRSAWSGSKLFFTFDYLQGTGEDITLSILYSRDD